jgi:hypothetical protein
MNTHDDSRENPAVADILAQQAADRRVSLSRQECQIAGGWGATSQIEKENKGKLHRYLDGSRIRVTTASFYAHLIELASAEPRKVRVPPKRFVKNKHHPTLKENTNTARRRKAVAAG